MKRALLFGAVSLWLGVTACDKGEKAESIAENKTTQSVTRAAEATPPATTAQAAPTTPIKDLDEDGVKALSKKLTGEMVDLMVRNAADCEKLATELTAFSDKNGSTLSELKAAGLKFKKSTAKMTPEEISAARKDMEEMSKKMAPVVQNCAKNAGVMAAMQKMPM